MDIVYPLLWDMQQRLLRLDGQERRRVRMEPSAVKQGKMNAEFMFVSDNIRYREGQIRECNLLLGVGEYAPRHALPPSSPISDDEF